MEHARSQIGDIALFTIVFGFAAGVIFESFAGQNTPMLVCISVFSLASLIVFCFTKKSRLIFLAIGLSLLSLIGGIVRSDSTRPDTERFASLIGTKVTVEGIVAVEPSQKNGGERFVLDVSPAVRDTGHNVSISVAATAATEIFYGDLVTVTGKLETPANFMTDQGTEFDYVSYLYKDNILYQMQHATVAVLSHGNGQWVVAHLIHEKNAILKSFHTVLSARDADLLAGLNLGEKSNIDKDFRDALVTTGTIHMIALSGYNVTVIANALRDFFTDILGLAPRGAQVSGAVGIIAFVIMTGLQSSAIRAGIMALIGLFARGIGRTYNAFRALLLAGFLMILWDPKYLVYDVSFELSFLATLGIIFLTPVLERKFRRVPKKILFVVPLRELMSVTLGAQIAVLPFILYKMGTLSFIALPANILVLPAVPFAMGFGLATGLVGAFSPLLAYPVAQMTHFLLSYITGLVFFFSKVPYASVTLRRFPIALTLVLYGVLAAVIFRAYRGKNEKT